MTADWMIILKLSACFIALFAVAELLYRLLKVKAEITRKIVHVGTGLLTLLFPIYFTHLWQVALICSSFLVLLLLSRKFGFLPSINAVSRSTTGSILYPVIVVIVFAFYQYMQSQPAHFNPLCYFYLPILIMAICDPLAALAGKLYQRVRGHVTGKTFAGSLTFFIAAIIVCIGILLSHIIIMIPTVLMVSFIILTSLLAAIAERYSNKGWDNFTIPAVVMLCLYLLEHFA